MRSPYLLLFCFRFSVLKNRQFLQHSVCCLSRTSRPLEVYSNSLTTHMRSWLRRSRILIAAPHYGNNRGPGAMVMTKSRSASISTASICYSIVVPWTEPKINLGFTDGYIRCRTAYTVRYDNILDLFFATGSVNSRLL